MRKLNVIFVSLVVVAFSNVALAGKAPAPGVLQNISGSVVTPPSQPTNKVTLSDGTVVVLLSKERQADGSYRVRAGISGKEFTMIMDANELRSIAIDYDSEN